MELKRPTHPFCCLNISELYQIRIAIDTPNVRVPASHLVKLPHFQALDEPFSTVDHVSFLCLLLSLRCINWTISSPLPSCQIHACANIQNWRRRLIPPMSCYHHVNQHANPTMLTCCFTSILCNIELPSRQTTDVHFSRKGYYLKLHVPRLEKIYLYSLSIILSNLT